VSELTQRRRGRVFGYQRYMKLLNAEVELPGSRKALQTS
jgi:hypothetical protein